MSTATIEPQSGSSSSAQGDRIHIVSTPDTCFGQPRINGTRIRVWDVYCWYEREGRSVDQIVSDFPQLSPADVHAAMTYYWDHQDGLHRYHDELEKRVEEIKNHHQSLLKEKLAKEHASIDQVSS